MTKYDDTWRTGSTSQSQLGSIKRPHLLGLLNRTGDLEVTLFILNAYLLLQLNLKPAITSCFVEWLTMALNFVWKMLNEKNRASMLIQKLLFVIRGLLRQIPEKMKILLLGTWLTHVLHASIKFKWCYQMEEVLWYLSSTCGEILAHSFREVFGGCLELLG